jgi:hypothetical protein
MATRRDEHVPLSEYSQCQASIFTAPVAWHAVHRHGGVGGRGLAEAETHGRRCWAQNLLSMCSPCQNSVSQLFDVGVLKLLLH